jgi:amino acid permease
MNGLLVLLCLGNITIYFNLFGDIFSGLIRTLTDNEHSTSFFMDPKFYILIMAVLNLLPIYQRAIKELKIVSILLFTSISIFTVFMVVYLAYQGTEQNPQRIDDNFSYYWTFHFDNQTISCFSV